MSFQKPLPPYEGGVEGGGGVNILHVGPYVWVCVHSLVAAGGDDPPPLKCSGDSEAEKQGGGKRKPLQSPDELTFFHDWHVLCIHYSLVPSHRTARWWHTT